MFEPDQIALSSDLEKELCLAINREMHVSYCYLVMSGIFTRYEVASLRTEESGHFPQLFLRLFT